MLLRLILTLAAGRRLAGCARPGHSRRRREAAIIIDNRTGAVLFEKNADERFRRPR